MLFIGKYCSDIVNFVSRETAGRREDLFVITRVLVHYGVSMHHTPHTDSAKLHSKLCVCISDVHAVRPEIL